MDESKLRARICDPATSFFRDFKPCDLDAEMAKRGFPSDWRFTDAAREATRARALAGRLDADLWIFAYGSLMWDPGIVFDEVRVGRVEGYARRFCLKDVFGARGAVDAPGLMVGLDRGEYCDGIVFRIGAVRVDEETDRLWRREMLAPAYLAAILDVHTTGGVVEALAFVADHAAPVIASEIPWADKVRFLATGTGILGSSLEYIENLAARLRDFDIEDRELSALLCDVQAYAARRADGDS
jgi:cation transport protein ChaC